MIFDIRNPLYPLRLMSGRAQTRRAWRLPLNGLRWLSWTAAERTRTRASGHDHRTLMLRGFSRIMGWWPCILEKTGNPLLLDTGKRLIVPLLAFTRMRVQARNLDASPWVPEVSNHQRILDALRMGDPHLVEQTVVHITGLFLKAALAVWASG